MRFEWCQVDIIVESPVGVNRRSERGPEQVGTVEIRI